MRRKRMAILIPDKTLKNGDLFNIEGFLYIIRTKLNAKSRFIRHCSIILRMKRDKRGFITEFLIGRKSESKRIRVFYTGSQLVKSVASGVVRNFLRGCAPAEKILNPVNSSLILYPPPVIFSQGVCICTLCTPPGYAPECSDDCWLLTVSNKFSRETGLRIFR